MIDAAWTLIATWESRAVQLDQWGAPEAATAFRESAKELKAALRSWLDEPLSIAAAAREVHRSERFLRERVSAGEIPRVRGGGSTRVLRKDLLQFEANTATEERPALQSV